MPSWMPGDDYYTNFRVGDPFIKVDQGFARLPGAGYAALHPELEDVDPEDYPDINKMAILADVAPYSREYNTYRLKVGKQAQGNTELQIEYEKILERVRQTKESVIRMDDRRSPGVAVLPDHKNSAHARAKAWPSRFWLAGLPPGCTYSPASPCIWLEAAGILFCRYPRRCLRPRSAGNKSSALTPAKAASWAAVFSAQLPGRPCHFQLTIACIRPGAIVPQ